MPIIRSIRAARVHEIAKIKGSRFIGAVAPSADRAAAEAYVETRRVADPQATHHCFAYRLGLGENDFRFADDGEPSGTAGRPILKEIDGRGITDVVAVVTRFYGGTKLGSGGLVRAYSAAAAATLDLAEIVERPVTVSVALTFAYDLQVAVERALRAFIVTQQEADYSQQIAMRLAVPVEQRDDLVSAVTEATAGRVRVS